MPGQMVMDNKRSEKLLGTTTLTAAQQLPENLLATQAQDTLPAARQTLMQTSNSSLPQPNKLTHMHPPTHPTEDANKQVYPAAKLPQGVLAEACMVN